MAGHLFHRTSGAPLPTVAGGEGIYLIDAAGKRYLDGSGGAAVSCLGHGHPRVTRAIVEQAQRIAYAHTSFLTNEPAERLADILAQQAPAGLERVYFVDSGSEAVETALKMARQYFLEVGEPTRARTISRRQSYHGNTLGALSVGGNRWRRGPFEPLLTEASFIEPCFEYRHRHPSETAEAYGERAAASLEAEILRVGPGSVMAFIAETVVGATAGAVPPAPGYFARIREICDRYGVLLILDEVMSGTGRTGTFLACEQDGIVPDLATVAKGLGAGYQPIGAVLTTDRIHDAFAAGSGAFQNGHTYSAHPIACAAALAVQETIVEENLLARVRDGGAHLRARLTGRFGNSAHVGDIRGRGLLQAIEIVADRAAKQPFDRGLKVSQRIKVEALARGLIVYPGSGTADGLNGDHILLAPPYIATDAELDEIVGRLGEAVDAATAVIA